MGDQKKNKSAGIVSWPEDERPRERLLARGAHALTDAELLAILLRTGIQGKSAVQLGRELLKRFNLYKSKISPLCSVLEWDFMVLKPVLVFAIAFERFQRRHGT